MLKRSLRIKQVILFLAIIWQVVLSPTLVFAQADTGIDAQSEMMEGRVVKILATGKESFDDELVDFQELEIKLISGSNKGEVIKIKNSASGMGMVNVLYMEYEVGDKLKIVSNLDQNNQAQYFIDGQSKRESLLALFLIFLLVVLLVGRVWGFLSLLGLLTSFIVIFKFIIPAIINGMDPMLASVIGAVIIIPTTFYISHGFNRKTNVGIIATFIALLITGFLAVYFTNASHLTGFASEEAGFLQVERQGSIDIKGLLLAGIIIGTLGILDDVTIGQASAVKQLKKNNHKLGVLALFKNGMEIGQDHISSMVNTLVLVYSGSALPLLLLFFGSNKSFIDIVEFELIAEEIIRMLVGSIGLILAAPLSTIIAAYVFGREGKD